MNWFILLILFLIIVGLLANYNWLLVIAVGILLFSNYFKTYARKRLITFDIHEATFSHKKFGELTGIKSAIEGKDYEHWTSNDKKKWDKIASSPKYKKSRVTLTYLPSEDAYYVNNWVDSQYIAFCEDSNNCIYSAVVLGDENSDKPYLEFLLYERNSKIVPCLKYRKGKYAFKKEDITFETLCEFPPFLMFNKDKRLKKLGFELKKYGGDDVYTDDFGNNRLTTIDNWYNKNGVSIHSNY